MAKDVRGAHRRLNGSRLLCAFAFIGRHQISGDEAISEGFAQLDWRSFFHAIHHMDAPEALYYALLHVWSHVGTSAAMLRVLSGLAFVVTIPFAYAAARALYGSRVAIIAGGLLATSSFAINDGADNIRPYAFVLCFSTISTYAFVRSVASPDRLNLILYAASSAVAIYFHLFAGFVVLSHAVTLPILAPLPTLHLRRFFVTYAAMAALCFPLALLLRAAGAHQLDFMARPHLRDVLRVFIAMAGSGRLALIFGCFAVIALVVAVRRERRQTLAVLLWVCIPVVAAYCVSLTIPMFTARYFIVILVPFFVLVARGISAFRKPALVAALALAVVAVSMRLVWASRHAPGHYDGFRSAAAYVQARSAPDDGVVVIAPAPYYDYRAAVRTLPTPPAAPIVFPPDHWKFWLPKEKFRFPTAAVLDPHNRIWLVLTPPPAPRGRRNEKALRKEITSGTRSLQQAFHRFRARRIADFAIVDVIELERCRGEATVRGIPHLGSSDSLTLLVHQIFATACASSTTGKAGAVPAR